jgi:hypothetical protein
LGRGKLFEKKKGVFYHIGMKIFLNLIGFILALGTVAVVGETTVSWKGALIRGGLVSFLVGFALMCLGFLWNVLTAFYGLPEVDIILFAIGAAFALIGAKRVFTFTQPSQT